jgi:hypothetical protein
MDKGTTLYPSSSFNTRLLDKKKKKSRERERREKEKKVVGAPSSDTAEPTAPP